MIELANKPQARRDAASAAAQAGKSIPDSLQQHRSRPGHAWPFLSPRAARPEHRPPANPSNGSGS